MSKGQLDPLNLDWVVRSPTQVVNPTDIYSPLSSKQLDYSLRNSQQEAHHHHHNHQHRIRSESSSSSEIAMSPSLSESEMSPLSPLGDSSRNSSTDSKVFRINSIQPLRNSQSFKISRESSKNQSNEKLSSSYTDKNDIEKSRRSNNIIQNFPPDPQKTIRRTKSTSEVLKNLQNPSSNSITSTNNYGSPPSNSGHHLFRTRKTLNDLQPISRINNATKEKSKEKEPRLSSGGFFKSFFGGTHSPAKSNVSSQPKIPPSHLQHKHPHVLNVNTSYPITTDATPNVNSTPVNSLPKATASIPISKKNNSTLDSSNIANITSTSPTLQNYMDDDFHLGLEKYLKTVKAKNRSNASGDNAPSQSTLVVDENLTDSYLELKKTEKRDKYTKYDVLGRPLPKHPPKSNLPSALKKNKSLQSYSSYSQTSHVHQVGSKSNHSSNSSDLSSTSTNSSLQELPDSTNTITSNPTSAASGDSSGNGFLSSLFKRRSSIQQTSQLQQQLQSQRVPSKPGTGSSSSRPSASSASTISASTSDLNFTKVPGLQNLKPMKRILFDPSTYYNDPPQQICGKNPRKGEVEVKSDGTVIIHRLTAEQRRQLMDTSSYGIVIGGSSKLKMLNPSDDAPISNPSNSIGTLSVNDSKDYTKKRQLQIKEAEEAAEARANPSDDDQQSIMSEKASKLKIDKPMISRHSTRQSNDFPISDYSDEEDYHMHGLPDVNVSNDVLYTRCCHLREILPIPATLKQLKKHPNGPIPLLQLRNPKPSMIEIFSFSDFISIAPVLAISLDGVSLSCEMLRVILSSIIIKKDFIKITLRNTPIDADGWKILSSFIADSKSLSSIDLTMVPTIKTNVQKPSKASLKDHSIPRMKCDLSNRSSMNWDLMSAAIATRGGLNEIILSGAKMSDTEFKNFIEVACITTERIGLAYNSLTTKKYKILAKWLVKSKITGIDLGYNDLKDNLSIFSKLILDKVHNKGKSNELQFISLNATNLDIPEGSTSENNEVIKFINALCCCEKLKFLDLSNNPKLFPYGLKPIIYSLPMLTSLVRINLDYEEFSEKDALILLSALPLCTNLNAVSILGLQGTPLIGRALCDLLKRTQNLISLEVEYDKLPDDVKKEFQVITMHNVQKGVDKVNGITHGMQFKGKKLIDFHELSLLLTESFDNKEKYTKIVNHFLDKTAYARDRLLNVVRDLFLVRQRNELNSQGKAVLIRLCFIDDCLKKGISILTCRKNNLLNSSSEDIKANKTNSANPTIGSVNSSNSMLELSGETFKNEISEDHAVFLPFGKAAIENKAISAEDAVQITEDDDIFEYLSKETEKEQNILKRKENLEGELRERVSKIDPYLNKEKLRKAAESGDTERLKNLILENKVSTIVEIIDELHNQGFHLHDLFSKQKLDLDGSIYEKESSSKHSEERSRSSIKSKNNNKLNNELEEAYDSVLDEFQMKRTE